MEEFDFTPYKKIVDEINPISKIGQVVEIIGLVIEADGPVSSIGDRRSCVLNWGFVSNFLRKPRPDFC